MVNISNEENLEHDYINNKVEVIGVVEESAEFSHEIYKEKFYKFKMAIKRLSNIEDIIPILVSEKLINPNDVKKGTKLKVKGQYRSYNSYDNGRTHLELMIFAKEIELIPMEEEIVIARENITNKIFLHGYICKKPIFRVTPFGREVADILIAVNRANNKSDYIPCIAWGRDAKFVDKLEVGSEIELEGRIQSRTYEKVQADNTVITKIAYEISIITIEHCNEEEKSEEA